VAAAAFGSSLSREDDTLIGSAGLLPLRRKLLFDVMLEGGVGLMLLVDLGSFFSGEGEEENEVTA